MECGHGREKDKIKAFVADLENYTYVFGQSYIQSWKTHLYETGALNHLFLPASHLTFLSFFNNVFFSFVCACFSSLVLGIPISSNVLYNKKRWRYLLQTSAMRWWWLFKIDINFINKLWLMDEWFRSWEDTCCRNLLVKKIEINALIN